MPCYELRITNYELRISFFYKNMGLDSLVVVGGYISTDECIKRITSYLP
ncbi:hypothetical protein ACE193_05290 [Bernardetia sp. OM2101]